jgi:hypothetical protein
MKYQKIAHLNGEKFRRLTGVKPSTFRKMLEILTAAHKAKKSKGGRPNSIEVSQMLLMTLEYMREYRTYFHIGVNYGISESYAYKTIKWVEDTLIRDATFSLPGRKELLKSDSEIEVVLIDATESPVQRPKKDRGITTAAKRSGTH